MSEKKNVAGVQPVMPFAIMMLLVWLKMKRALNIRRLMKASVCGAVNALRYVR